MWKRYHPQQAIYIWVYLYSTNTMCLKDLDDAVLRRFTKRIYVRLPCTADRGRLVQQLLGQQYNELSEREVPCCTISTINKNLNEWRQTDASEAYICIQKLFNIICTQNIKIPEYKLKILILQAHLKHWNISSSSSLCRCPKNIKILTQVPHCADTPKILKFLIVQMHQIAQLTSGYSGSDLAALARDAAYGPIRFSSSIVLFFFLLA